MTMAFSGGGTSLLKSYENFSSKFVDARRVDIWLPPGYDRDPSQRFPVVYMQDGQNLFDPHYAFTGIPWGIDRTMLRLIQQNKIREALVVGVLEPRDGHLAGGIELFCGWVENLGGPQNRPGRVLSTGYQHAAVSQGGGQIVVGLHRTHCREGGSDRIENFRGSRIVQAT
jgi:hypothetical protein